jgi:hypothetical protein
MSVTRDNIGGLLGGLEFRLLRGRRARRLRTALSEDQLVRPQVRTPTQFGVERADLGQPSLTRSRSRAAFTSSRLLGLLTRVSEKPAGRYTVWTATS